MITAEDLRTMACLNGSLLQQLNTEMNKLGNNNCAMENDEEEVEMGIATPYTFTSKRWEKVRNDHEHWLNIQAVWFPIASEMGLLTSRKEEEWNDDLNSSSDLTYLGAIQIVIKMRLNNSVKEPSKEVLKS